MLPHEVNLASMISSDYVFPGISADSVCGSCRGNVYNNLMALSGLPCYDHYDRDVKGERNMNAMGGLPQGPQINAGNGLMPSAASQAAPLDPEEELRGAQDSYNSLKQENSDLQASYSTNVTSMKRNKTTYKIARTVALAGLGTFITAAVMSSMVPFVAGAAVGSVAYIASGFFKGRTQFFNDKIVNTCQQITNSSTQMEKAEKRLNRAQHVVDKSRKDMDDYMKGLDPSASRSSIIEDDNVLTIGGVSLRKRKPHLKSIVSDLFGKLDNKE